MRFALETQLLRLVPALALGALALSSSPSAHAHFTLTNPPSWIQEDAQGNPQKSGPCGGAVGGAGVTPTNTVTTYTAGETIMVTWKETVGHPGHFRISLTEGESRDSLVTPPVVTSNGDGVSGNSISTTTVPDGTGVVLLDNLYPRENVAANMPQAEPFTQAVTLPNRTCEKCTLQVTQFMTQHAPGYFYYHCADIKIVASGAAPAGTGGSAALGTGGSAAAGAAGSANTGAGGSTSSAGSSSNPDLGDDSSEEDDGGCSISNGAPSPLRSSAAALGLIGLAVSFWRRRTLR
jgi:hypothetical protein